MLTIEAYIVKTIVTSMSGLSSPTTDLAPLNPMHSVSVNIHTDTFRSGLAFYPR